MITASVIAELDAFSPGDEDENVGRLYEILGRLKELAPELRRPVMPAMLALIERYPEAELGSPGPLVHELEGIPGYEPLLRASVLRQPTDLGIWMINRILNAKICPEVRDAWHDLLRTAASHPLASKETQYAAGDFLAHQGK
jgi:hypothetical protein